MKTPSSPDPEVLRPVEQDPAVQGVWQTVLAARQAVRAAAERLTRARDIAGKQFRESPTHLREPQWSTRDFWRSRRDLPELERVFDAAQEGLADAEARHTEAVTAAKAMLVPKIQAQLVPQFKAALAALASVRPVLAAWADGVRTASELGVTAPGPGLLLTILATDMATLAATIEAWEKGPPRAPALPAGHVLVTCRKPFRLLLTGAIDPNQATGLGAAFLPGEVCGVDQETADALVREGRAELAAR